MGTIRELYASFCIITDRLFRLIGIKLVEGLIRINKVRSAWNPLFGLPSRSVGELPTVVFGRKLVSTNTIWSRWIDKHFLSPYDGVQFDTSHEHIQNRYGSIWSSKNGNLFMLVRISGHIGMVQLSTGRLYTRLIEGDSVIGENIDEAIIKVIFGQFYSDYTKIWDADGDAYTVQEGIREACRIEKLKRAEWDSREPAQV